MLRLILPFLCCFTCLTSFSQNEPDETIPGVGGGSTYLAPFKGDSILFVEILKQNPSSLAYYYKKKGGSFTAIMDHTYAVAKPFNQRGGVYNETGFLGIHHFDADHYGLYQFDYETMTAELLLDTRDEELFEIHELVAWGGEYILRGTIYEIDGTGNRQRYSHIYKFNPQSGVLTNLSEGIHGASGESLGTSAFFKTSNRLLYSNLSGLWEVGENSVSKVANTGCADCFQFDNWIAAIEEGSEEYIYLRGHYDENFQESQGTYLWKEGQFTKLGDFSGLYTQGALAPPNGQVYFNGYLYALSDNFGLVKITPSNTGLFNWPSDEFGNEVKLTSVAHGNGDFVLFHGSNGQLWKFDGEQFKQIRFYSSNVFPYKGTLYAGGYISYIENPGDFPESLYGIYKVENDTAQLIWEGRFQHDANPVGLLVFEDIFYFTQTRNGFTNHYSLPFDGVSNEPTTNLPPKFEGETQTVTITENYAAGDEIVTLQATDPNGDELAYTITAGNVNNLFALNTQSGLLTATEDITVSTDEQTYQLTVRASDGELTDDLDLAVVFTESAEAGSGFTNLRISFLKDLVTGTASSAPQGFVSVGDTVYFTAHKEGNSSDFFLFKSDGTPDGTGIVGATVNYSLEHNMLFKYADTLHFVGEEQGASMWHLVAYEPAEGATDYLAYGANSLYIFEVFNNWILYGRDLVQDFWATDGVQHISFERTNLSGITFRNSLILPANNSILYSIDQDLVRTVLKDYSFNADYSFAGGFDQKTGQTSDYLFYTINKRLETNTGNEELWVTDGTPGGTALLLNHEFTIEESTSFNSFTQFINLGDYVLFKTNVQQLNGNSWLVTDGKAGGTRFIPGYGFNPAVPSDGVFYQGKYYSYASGNSEHTQGLYAFEPATNSFELILPTDYDLANFQLFGNQFIFSNEIEEVFISDGTAAGTIVIPYLEDDYKTFSINNLYVHSDSLIFMEANASKSGSDLGRELWKIEYVEIVNQAPQIASQTFVLEENADQGTAVGTITATDADGDVLTYAITDGNSSGAFSLHQSTGDLTVADETLLDFETTPVFTLQVAVNDGNGGVANATITINLVDADEGITGTAPSIPGIKVFPIPTRNAVSVNVPAELVNEAFYRLTDISGSSVEASRITETLTRIQLPAKGLWLLHVTKENATSVHKLIRK